MTEPIVFTSITSQTAEYLHLLDCIDNYTKHPNTNLVWFHALMQQQNIKGEILFFIFIKAECLQNSLLHD